MKNFIQAIKELQEEKPGLWANIRAKRARGEKPAHKNSNAHKDAVKAGKKINKEGKLSESKGAKLYFDDLRYYYTKTLRHLDKDEVEEYKQLVKNFFSRLPETTEGLWANINAKKKAGKKSSHGNSNAHKDAVAAGNKLKEGSEQDLKRGDQVTFKADPKAIWKILGIHGNTYRVNQQGERTMSYQPKPWLHNMIATGKATVI